MEIYNKIKNTKDLAVNDLRKDALAIAEAGFLAIDTKEAIRQNVVLGPETLTVKGNIFELKDVKRLFVVGIGKCSLDAAEVLEEILGDRIYKGMVIDVKGNTNLKYIKSFEGDHPFPTDRNVDLTSQMIGILREVNEHDLVIAIISGGGSTMLCQPLNFTCHDEKEVLDCLFRGGATIQEINTIRKHLSLARGGFLAKHAHPARVVSLIFSDVVGNNLEYIASGPTILDTTTIEEAIAIAEKYHINERCGFSPENLLETPKDPSCFEKVSNILLVSNLLGLEAMRAKAEELGYKSTIADTDLVGEATDVGFRIANKIHNEESKSALIYGGETIVRIKGTGKGGRNQELALSALRVIKENECLIAFASDGRDNSDVAGALCDTITKQKALDKKLDPNKFLADNNSYAFFSEVKDAVVTGITGSNTADFTIALKG
jgi:glycerate-2-kinase